MRGIWAAAFLLRRLRAERGIVLLLVALVGVTSFLVAAAPRLYNLVADAGLRREVAEASTARRNIELVQQLVMPPGEEPADLVDRLGRTYLSLFGERVQSLVATREVVITSPRFGLRQPPRYTTYVSLRHQSGLGEAVRLVDGRWPASTGERLPAAALEFGPPAGEVPDEPTRIEIAVSTTTAEESGLALGQIHEAAIDSADPLLPRALVQPLLARLEVVGIFDVDDPGADAWYSNNQLQRVGADFNAETPIVFVTALIAPEAHPDLVSSNLPFRYEWHYFLDPERMDAAQLTTVIPELRRMGTTFSTSTFASGDPERIIMRTDLEGVIDGYLAQRAASEAVLSVAAIGPLALAAGSIGMLAVLLIARRRTTLLLARGRGAATGLILGAQAWEATVIAGSATLAGLVIAMLVVPGRASELSVLLAAGTGLASVLLLVGATLPAVRRPLDQAGRDERPPLRAAPRRLVLELTAVLLAAIGVVLLRERGLTIDDGGRAVVRFDPFLAAVPVLTGLAAGLIATRLYPLPIRALGWLAARRRDLVPVLGLRNIGRRPSFATLPLLVLMLTAAFGSFALVVTTGVDRGQIEASWREVGADYRIEAPPGADLQAVDPAQIAGVEAVAPAYVNPTASFELGVVGRTARIHFEAIDAVAYATVAAGSPTAVAWPAEFLGVFDATGIGTLDNPIPVIVSRALPSGAVLGVGDTTRVRVGDRSLTFRVVDVRATMPGLGVGQSFLVASLPAVLADPPRGVERNVLYVRGPASAGDGLSALVDEAGPAATVLASRHSWYEQLRGAPLIAVVGDGFRLGLIVAVAYAALAVITALTLTAARRTQDLAFLRTLGLSRGQAAGITVIEHATPVLVALVPGIATGIAVAMLLESSLGLDAFIGAGTAFRVQLDWPGLAGMAGLLLLVVAVAITVSTWLARRAPVVEALRVGEA
jgi:putative ABC transport system permease protein